jgi:hypothetical protein
METWESVFIHFVEQFVYIEISAAARAILREDGIRP